MTLLERLKEFIINVENEKPEGEDINQIIFQYYRVSVLFLWHQIDNFYSPGFL